MKNFLPIGTVVLLKGASKKLMIMGILQAQKEGDKVFDYVGVPFPEGHMGGGNSFLFDEEDINDIVFRGYENGETKAMMKLIEAINDEMKDDL